MNKMIGNDVSSSESDGSSDIEIDEEYLDEHLCNPRYSSSTKSKVPFGPGGVWKYEEVDYPKIYGRHEDYDGNGFTVYLSTNAETLVEQTEFLFENGWIDKSTRAITVIATFVNPSTNVYTVGELLLELPPGGDYLATPHYFIYRVEL